MTTTAFLPWLRKILSRPDGAATPLSFTRRQVYVHPCVIGNRPHIVYPRGLKAQAPELFESLQNHYRQQGYALKEDQRQANAARSVPHERRRWAVIVLFTVDLLFESVASAGTIHTEDATPAPASKRVELLLVPNPNAYPTTESFAASAASKTPAIDADAAERIYDLLTQRYKRTDSDPAYILGDFREIANYYSAFPEIIGMLDALKDKNWRLVYNERVWVTTASGNAFQVESVSVNFNTRSAAQLILRNRCKENPVCIASPADALLHELLHAYSMLVNTREFIAQGGMSSVLYPYRHEYAVIDAERRLYASMSRRDLIKRPQRVDHTGRLVKAHCSICIN